VDWIKLIQEIPVLRGFRLKREDCRLILDQKPEEEAPIFVAVHGTWGSRSAWTHQNSAIFKTLLAKYPGAGLFRYEWSGINGIRHRLLAAEILHDELNGLLAAHPTSDVITISHSHGGNVAAWASTDLSRPLFTSIYLNTPFIQVLDSINAAAKANNQTVSDWIRSTLNAALAG
jgi:hypothetical protein